MALPGEQLPCVLEGVGLSPTCGRVFSYVCAHFGVFGRRRIILLRFRLRGQLQYRTASCWGKYKNISTVDLYDKNIFMIKSALLYFNVSNWLVWALDLVLAFLSTYIICDWIGILGVHQNPYCVLWKPWLIHFFILFVDKLSRNLCATWKFSVSYVIILEMQCRSLKLNP
mgnify:CR=1 FL=1